MDPAMGIVTFLLYFFAVFLLIVFLICFTLLIIPMSYKLSGGYNDFIQINFNISFSPLLAARGSWSNKAGDPVQAKILFAGLPFSLDPEKWGKEKKKEKEKQGGSPSFSVVLHCLNRDFIGSVKLLLVDILRILRPKKAEVKGKIGFPEPHLNGWLAAVTSMPLEFQGDVVLEIEPVWEEELYQFSFNLEGKMILIVLLFKVGRFALQRRTRELLKMLKKEKASHAA